MESLDNLRPIEARTTTLRDNVTEILRWAIIDGSLAPGAELVQAQMAKKLGISRGPLRESLGQLEQEGLIRNVPFKGVYVTPLTVQYVEELYSIRAVLETFALKRGMSKFREEDIQSLKEYVDEMREAAKSHDRERLAELDRAFHHHIVTTADHELLLSIWNRLEIGVLRCLHTRHRIYSDLDEIVGSHPALIEAIEDADVTVATQILHDHIIEAGARICESWPDEADGLLDESTESQENTIEERVNT